MVKFNKSSHSLGNATREQTKASICWAPGGKQSACTEALGMQMVSLPFQTSLGLKPMGTSWWAEAAGESVPRASSGAAQAAQEDAQGWLFVLTPLRVPGAAGKQLCSLSRERRVNAIDKRGKPQAASSPLLSCSGDGRLGPRLGPSRPGRPGAGRDGRGPPAPPPGCWGCPGS